MTLRERINSDPKLQIGIGVVLLLVVGFLLLGKGGGDESEGEAVVEGPVAGAVVEEAPLGAEAASSTEGSVAAISSSVPAPPLPPAVAAAYEANDVVGVLFVRDGGIDDKLVKRYANLVRAAASGTVKLWVVPVKEIAKYGAVTLGLGVQRVPAFVFLRPKSLSEGGIQGSVLYGYQTPANIIQALADATYDGPDGSYHPG